MHRLIQSLARLTALAGGFVLIVLIVLTSLSIIGRSVNKLLHNDFFQQKMTGFSQALLDLGIGEINGSYELLEAGVAFSIFSFLPLCQLYGSHATVDVFTAALPLRANRWIAAFWEIVLALVLLLIIWRLYEGMQRYIGNGETTLFLQFPVWWAYAASFAAGVVTCIVAAYCAVMRLLEAVQNHSILPSEHGEH
ncbi:TRAP transporter small permease [Sulfitobacter mediterraneus]|uniref:TRAP transporter small permease protein n=1 Tax=Sulfitobacter mediterraneus TaxID=83219 RepID=A0A061SS16_9RHOB|nr:TRAP transporter small permease [Sulfitobacter mediterraneus]KAJ04516.1 C4-dicarboxylate ABC transporter permease [Sulfitobacter mediterraneus]MBM1555742.1 TRAP transporter small permease [Sulfitobacter mediterraneus]MBM1566705.1 TRAP transporter small permease [Sulfitobacter mediterraneus]MBM1570507.1 TRAP transporter small permease [Sulfitobacter mediterraneus]MBM1574306.1 TRAP transporter small permease [Sulfitobacter mediterraneus]